MAAALGRTYSSSLENTSPEDVEGADKSKMPLGCTETVTDLTGHPHKVSRQPENECDKHVHFVVVLVHECMIYEHEAPGDSADTEDPGDNVPLLSPGQIFHDPQVDVKVLSASYAEVHLWTPRDSDLKVVTMELTPFVERSTTSASCDLFHRQALCGSRAIFPRG